MANFNISRRSFIFGGAACAVGAGLALSSCSGTSVSDTSSSDSKGLNAAVAYTAFNFSPIGSENSLVHSIGWHVYDSLYNVDMHDGNIVNGLAVSDPKEIDDVTYRVEIDTKKKFSNGQVVSPNDVVGSIGENLKDKIYSQLIDCIKSANIDGDSAVIINLKYHVSLDTLKNRLSVIKIFRREDKTDSGAFSFVGSGPWAVKAINGTDGGYVDFIPNGYYSGEHPARATSMRWNIVTDDYKRIDDLKGGKVSVIEDIPLREVNALKEKFSVDVVDSLSMPCMIFNMSRAPFNDVRVRQALMYGLNTESTIKDTLDGFAEVPNSFFPKNHKAYKEAKTVYKFDPEKSKALLKAAGRENLSINMLISYEAGFYKLAEGVERDLKEAGFNVNIKVENLRYDKLAEDPSSYDVIYAPVDTSLFGSADAEMMLSSVFADTEYISDIAMWAKDNDSKYSEFSEKLKNIRKFTEDKRKETIESLIDSLSEEVPIYPVMHRKMATAFNPRLIEDFKGIGGSGICMLECKSKTK